MSRRSGFPLLLLAEWIEGPRVRLFFKTGKIVDVDLPVKSAKNAKIVYGGVGLDADGKGYEISAATLHEMPGKVCGESYVEEIA